MTMVIDLRVIMVENDSEEGGVRYTESACFGEMLYKECRLKHFYPSIRDAFRYGAIRNGSHIAKI